MSRFKDGEIVAPTPGATPAPDGVLSWMALVLGGGSMIAVGIFPLNVVLAGSAIVAALLGWKAHRRVAAIGLSLGAVSFISYAAVLMYSQSVSASVLQEQARSDKQIRASLTARSSFGNPNPNGGSSSSNRTGDVTK